MASVRWTRLSWWILGLVLIAALTAPEIAAAERAVSARVDEPFEVNGELFRGGELTVRQVSMYNPATSLNEVCVGQRCLGLMLADSGTGAASINGDRLIFERNDVGRLVLVGFAYRDEAESQFYNYRVAANGGRWSAPVPRGVTEVARN